MASKKKAPINTDRKTSMGTWLRICSSCDEEFLIDGPDTRYKRCPDCREGETFGESLSERSKTRRITDGAELQYDDDLQDVKDKRDPELTPDVMYMYQSGREPYIDEDD